MAEHFVSNCGTDGTGRVKSLLYLRKGVGGHGNRCKASEASLAADMCLPPDAPVDMEIRRSPS